MNYLEKAVKELQPIYTTPKEIVDLIQLHLLIINPPYETNRQDNPNQRGLHGADGANA